MWFYDLSFFTKMIIEQKLSSEGTRKHINQFLVANPDWLLVYDNVINYDVIRQFLPEKGGKIHY